MLAFAEFSFGPDFFLQIPQVVNAAVDTGKVPPLASRWTEDGQTFVDFLGTTFQRYYEHAVGGKAAKGTMFCLIFILTVD